MPRHNRFDRDRLVARRFPYPPHQRTTGSEARSIGRSPDPTSQPRVNMSSPFEQRDVRWLSENGRASARLGSVSLAAVPAVPAVPAMPAMSATSSVSTVSAVSTVPVATLRETLFDLLAQLVQLSLDPQPLLTPCINIVNRIVSIQGLPRDVYLDFVNQQIALYTAHTEQRATDLGQVVSDLCQTISRRVAIASPPPCTHAAYRDESASPSASAASSFAARSPRPGSVQRLTSTDRSDPDVSPGLGRRRHDFEGPMAFCRETSLDADRRLSPHQQQHFQHDKSSNWPHDPMLPPPPSPSPDSTGSLRLTDSSAGIDDQNHISDVFDDPVYPALDAPCDGLDLDFEPRPFDQTNAARAQDPSAVLAQASNTHVDRQPNDVVDATAVETIASSSKRRAVKNDAKFRATYSRKLKALKRARRPDGTFQPHTP